MDGDRDTHEPADLLGFTEAYVPDTAEFDAVLIHSLGGDSRETWTNADAYEKRRTEAGKTDYVKYAEYWPFRPKFNSSSKGRILVFGYSSEVQTFLDDEQGKPSFLGNARELVKDLSDLRRSDPLRPLLWLGHGLGGYLIKECLRICRAEVRPDISQQLADISCATISVVFLCCPHQEGAGISLPDAVGKVLAACKAPNSQLLLDDLRGSTDAIKKLHEDFLAFVQERAPMLTVWTVQESSRRHNGKTYMTEPPEVNDASMRLNIRYERQVTAHVRFRRIPKVQYHEDWTLREACWRMSDGRMKDIFPEILQQSLRYFLPMRKDMLCLHRENEIHEILGQLRGSAGDGFSIIGISGPPSAGKTSVGLEVCDRILHDQTSEGAQGHHKSLFWIQASDHSTIDASLRGIAHAIGLPLGLSGDSFIYVMDWLNSAYSGEWILVFDDANHAGVFLSPFTRRNALAHSPNPCRLIDIIPRKKGCRVLLLTRDSSCLERFVEPDHGAAIETPQMDIQGRAEVFNHMVALFHSGKKLDLFSASERTRLVEAFPNLVALRQVAQQICSGYETAKSLLRAVKTLPKDNVAQAPSQLAVQYLKSHHPEWLDLVAALAMLDGRYIPGWLADEFTFDRDSSALDVLVNYGLLTREVDYIVRKPKRYIHMPQLIQDAVAASFTPSEWAGHVRYTISILFHAFMNLPTAGSNGISFHQAARSVARHLDKVRGNVEPLRFVDEELDKFRHFFGKIGTRSFRSTADDVFMKVAYGDLVDLHELLDFVNRGRGSSGSSMSMYWYVGRKPVRLDLSYE